MYSSDLSQNHFHPVGPLAPSSFNSHLDQDLPQSSPAHLQPSASSASLNPSPTILPAALPASQPIDFDEGVLRTLCGLECGLPLVLDRLKQAVGTSREVSTFLKKKALLEEEYGAKLAKLARERLDGYAHLGGELKAGSFARQYGGFLAAHERIGHERAEYGLRLGTVADELASLAKEVERVRKANKEVGWRLEKNLAESEGATEKAKAKFDGTAEELERVLLSKQGEPLNGGAGTLGGPGPGAGHQRVAQNKVLGKAISKLTTKGVKTAGQLARMEEEMRSKMSSVSDVYRAQVLATQQIRQEYFNLQLPRILRALKEHSDEIDLAMQYYLTNYSALTESLVVNEALSVSAVPSGHSGVGGQEASEAEGAGLKELVQQIDNREDFKEYMANYAAHFNQTHHGQLQHVTQSFVPTGPQMPISLPQPMHNLTGLPTQTNQGSSPRESIGSAVVTTTTIPIPGEKRMFGVELSLQMSRDGTDIAPKVLQKCIEAVEKFGGIDAVGIYRLSGTTSKIGKLKNWFETDMENVELEIGPTNQSEINDITGVMKLWLRELPEPLLTWSLYNGFIEAGRIENDRLRHIRLHEKVNDLPDPNYATLKYLMGHLDKVRRNESINSMGVSNLAVIFGPTLLSPPPPNYGAKKNGHSSSSNGSHNNGVGSGTLVGNSSHHNGGGGGLGLEGAAGGVGFGGGGLGGGLGGGNHCALKDMSAQCKVVETILEHYREIFIDEGEEEEEEDFSELEGRRISSSTAGGGGQQEPILISGVVQGSGLSISNCSTGLINCHNSNNGGQNGGGGGGV